ncbi:hypothetical protein ELE36_19500 [Pseudolysobacter antarcticus]|uniref:Delta-60 repeat domain-containing protein n=1 Tax=Pseudolysobacter antarcticus TaxID=2511995 RepID=A0A411HPF1_9GAMM|nr:hypothetical protein [Pseudolysobacter antarcticus]QBB72379.1 hypothetical protein ELE36_19500 [Pseudolysobacter antarcticus]
MRFFYLLLACIFSPCFIAQAAEHLSCKVPISSPVDLRAVALLSMPNGNVNTIFQAATQSGVCGSQACIEIYRQDANCTGLPNPFTIKSFGWSSVVAAALDSRGRMVVIGSIVGPGSNGSDFAIARFLGDGSDDPSFAGTGHTTVNFGLGQSNNDVPQALAIDADDNIVVVGSAQRFNVGDYDFAIARLRGIDGSLDTSFSTDGMTTVFFDLGPALRIDQANAVAIGNDGKIVIGGIAYDSAISRTRPVLAQLNADGSPDSSFCNTTCNLNAGYNTFFNGKRVYYFGTLSAHSDELRGIDVAANGDIVIAGTTYSDDGSVRKAAVARFTTLGAQTAEALEPGLNANGSFASVRFADGLGSRVIAAGDSGPGPNYFLLQAFTSTLGFDSSYGSCLTNSSGFCFIGTTGLGDDGPNAAAHLSLDARGRPMFTGTFHVSDDPNRGHILIQSFSNDFGPLPDRIFRNGFQ